MKVSVVMTTYNGDKYIIEQLDTLRKQTRIPDEVLIFDDGSTDTTNQLVVSYINKYRLKNWSYIVNEINKGWKKNFHEGVKAASGDLIFPCDQDDIWKLDKIENMANIMENNKDINVLVGKYEKFFIDKQEDIKSSANKNNKFILWEKTGLVIDLISNLLSNKKDDNSVSRKLFNKDFLQLKPGCCFCVRKNFYNLIEPYWFSDLGHDAFYSFFGKLTDSYAYYNRTVIDWRHYAGSTSRPKGRKKVIRLNENKRNMEVVNKLNEFLFNETAYKDENKIKILNDTKKWCMQRNKFFESKSIISGLYLFKYIRYYERYRAIITDWIYAYME